MSRITVLGLGAMGSRLAVNLLKAGHTLTVWNRSAQKIQPLVELGAIAAKTPFEAVQNAEFVISMVRDDEASREVWLGEQGALAGMRKDAVAIESSTLTVGWTRTLADAFQSAGVEFLDAPVAGSLPQAEAAQLIYLVGGSSETLAKAQPILQTLGGAVHHAGQPSDGMAIKLAVNTLFAVQAATLAELMGFLQKCGLEETQAVDILTATPVCSPAAKGLSAAMVARKFASMFPIELVEKDLGYLIASAEAIGVEAAIAEAAGSEAASTEAASARSPMTNVARQTFGKAIAQGKGADNITGIAQLYL